jgi:hypothetical protein
LSPRRRRLVVGGYLLISALALVAAALSSEQSDWRPVELLVVLSGFAIASELLPIELRPRSHRLGGWYFTSSAPFVLAAVCLGPAPALAVAFAGLAASSVVEKPPWPHLVVNIANYAFFSVASALAAGAAVDAFDIGLDDASLAVLVVAVYAFDLGVSFVMTAGHDALVEGEPVRATVMNQWLVQLAAEAPIALMTGLTVHLYGTSGLGALVVLAAVQLLFVHVARELHRSMLRASRISELSASRGKLVGQILDAEESERRRLAEALHDDAMQNLLAARQDLAEARSGPRWSGRGARWTPRSISCATPSSRCIRPSSSTPAWGPRSSRSRWPTLAAPDSRSRSMSNRRRRASATRSRSRCAASCSATPLSTRARPTSPFESRVRRAASPSR